MATAHGEAGTIGSSGVQPRRGQPLILATRPERRLRRRVRGLEEMLRRHRLQPTLVGDAVLRQWHTAWVLCSVQAAAAERPMHAAITVLSGRATGGQVRPGVRVAHPRDHLPHRFDHQLGLVLVDVVPGLAAQGEARVRDEGGLVLIPRAIELFQLPEVNPFASANWGNARPWARTARGIGRSGEAATASRTTALSVPHRNDSTSPYPGIGTTVSVPTP
jgi:hypothetical protein